MENAAQLIPAALAIIIILPDHRGTGLPTVLVCDDQDSQNISPDCITYFISKWGVTGLHQFSMTVAAHDLAIQIQSYQAEYSGRVSVYGVSYGTQWLDRFLQIYPTLVQSAVMDGVVNPLLGSVSRYDIWASAVGSQFLTYCQIQVECNQYFPIDQPPPILLFNILTQLDASKQKCVNNYFSQYQITSDKVRALFFAMIQSAEQYMDRTIL
ncbi:hypothetical protein I4U23_015261 [Adineta vaga]|nr:hypothetical protein I4U23_015261 [Adineta vaga]